MGMLSILDDAAGFLELREGLESEEVHLDESCALDDVSVVLRDGCLAVGEVRVVGSGDGDVVADGVAADDESAGVDACVADGSFELEGVLDGVGFLLVPRVLCFFQLGCGADVVLQCRFLAVGQAVWHGFAPGVDGGERYFLDSSYVLEAALGCHGSVGDDVCAVFGAVLVHDPLQHLASAVVVEVGVDIGQ